MKLIFRTRNSLTTHLQVQ